MKQKMRINFKAALFSVLLSGACVTNVARALDGDSGKEIVVAPELRQHAFDNYETQDDHAK